MRHTSPPHTCPKAHAAKLCSHLKQSSIPGRYALFLPLPSGVARFPCNIRPATDLQHKKIYSCNTSLHHRHAGADLTHRRRWPRQRPDCATTVAVANPRRRAEPHRPGVLLQRELNSAHRPDCQVQDQRVHSSVTSRAADFFQPHRPCLRLLALAALAIAAASPPPREPPLPPPLPPPASPRRRGDLDAATTVTVPAGV